MAGPEPRHDARADSRDMNARTQGVSKEHSPRRGRLPRLACSLSRAPRSGCPGHQVEERAFNSVRDSSVTAFGQ
jgi:hypothetical protein